MRDGIGLADRVDRAAPDISQLPVGCDLFRLAIFAEPDFEDRLASQPFRHYSLAAPSIDKLRSALELLHEARAVISSAIIGGLPLVERNALPKVACIKHSQLPFRQIEAAA